MVTKYGLLMAEMWSSGGRGKYPFLGVYLQIQNFILVSFYMKKQNPKKKNRKKSFLAHSF